MTEEYINRGDTVLGIYKDKYYKDIMQWPAHARETLLSKWEDENFGRDRDKIKAGEALYFPTTNFLKQRGFRAGIGDDKALNIKQYMDIMRINSGSRLAGENAVNSLRNVVGMSANFTLPKSAVSATYLKHIMGLQDDEIVSKIIHMANNADLESMDDYDRWYNQWGFDRKYYKEASESFEKYIKGREAELESGRKATKFKAWEEEQVDLAGASSFVGISKDQILKQIKDGKILYKDAPEMLRQALNLGGIDQKDVEAALTSFLKEIEEFKPHDPESAKNMERWVELASMGEKEAGVRREDLLKLNAEVRASVTSWFMKGLPGTTDEESRESMVGGSMWNVVNQLSSAEQNAVWNFLKAQSPFPDSFDSGAFGDSRSAKKLEAKAESGTDMVTVRYRGKEARPIEVQNYPVVKNDKGKWVSSVDVEGGDPIPYDIKTTHGQRARQKQLRDLLYPQYIIDQILDSEIIKAGGTPP